MMRLLKIVASHDFHFRVRLAYHVLRGRPLMYRMHVHHSEMLVQCNGAIIAECRFCRTV